MPRTIKDYAIDYNKNKIIELKKTDDSFASAANYLNKIGWKKNDVCYLKIDLKDSTPLELLNSSARKLKSKKKVKYLKNIYQILKNLLNIKTCQQL